MAGLFRESAKPETQLQARALPAESTRTTDLLAGLANCALQRLSASRDADL